MAKQKRKFKKNKVKAAIAFVVLVAIISIASYVIYQNTGYEYADLEYLIENAVFANGITVEQVDISGMKYTDAMDKLEPTTKEKIENFSIQINFETKKYEIPQDDINANTNIVDVLNEAIAVGKTGKRGQRSKELSTVEKNGKNFNIGYTYDSDLFEKKLTEIEKSSDNTAKNATIKLENGALNYIEGKEGIKIVREGIENDIRIQIEEGKENIVVDASTQVVQPEITVAMLKSTLVKKSTTSTTFKTSDETRVKNVVKAGEMLNGTMISPGETMSINSVLGARTTANGWHVATGIANGKYIDDVGGGVCQVSSTLYNSAIKSGLEITARRAHTFPVAYLPVGQDAAISTGGPDLKIKNNYDFPIYIVTSVSASTRVLDITVYGPKNEDGSSILFKSEEVSRTDHNEKAVIKYNDNLLEGEYVEVKPRKQRVEVKRWLEYVIDGKVVKEQNLSNDVYNAFRGEYIVGKGTKLDETSGKPVGKQVNESLLTEKRTTVGTTQETSNTKETQENTNNTEVTSSTVSAE